MRRGIRLPPGTGPVPDPEVPDPEVPDAGVPDPEVSDPDVGAVTREGAAADPGGDADPDAEADGGTEAEAALGSVRMGLPLRSPPVKTVGALRAL
jgi:hypothetical protein